MGKQSSKTYTSANTVYGNTTTSNPYAVATTNNGGTSAKFQEGTALDSVYKFVNNINSLLDEYLNPTLDSTTNQAKLNAFTKTLNNTTLNNLENNIINPLSNRNMVRSSQATDLYKNLSNQNTNSLSSYIDELLSESQNNTAQVMNNLLASYMQGYNVISDMQNQSLQTSSGNASTSGYQSTKSKSINASDISSMVGSFFKALL